MNWRIPVLLFIALIAFGCVSQPADSPSSNPTSSVESWAAFSSSGVSFSYPPWPTASLEENEIFKVQKAGCSASLSREGNRVPPDKLLYEAHAKTIAAYLESNASAEILSTLAGDDFAQILLTMPIGGAEVKALIRYSSCGPSIYRAAYSCAEDAYDEATALRVVESLQCSAAVPTPEPLVAPRLEEPVAFNDRPFDLAFTLTPRSFKGEWMQEAAEFAAQHADVALVQHTPLWREFAEGDEPQSANTTSLVYTAAIARDKGLKLFLAVSPLNFTRDGLEVLPAEWGDAKFSDSRVRNSFKKHVKWLAEKFQPEYMAVGEELNMYAENRPDDYEYLVSLYKEAYAEAKRVSPQTLVFPTLQYEVLNGLTPGKPPAQPKWNHLKDFAEISDAVAISTYPYIVFSNWSVVPEDYYAKLSEHTKKPILVSEGGWPSRPGKRGFDTSEKDQEAFVLRLAMQASEWNSTLLTLWTAFDLTTEMTWGGGDIVEAFRDIGLWNSDGTPKLAGKTWTAIKALPKRQ